MPRAADKRRARKRRRKAARKVARGAGGVILGADDKPLRDRRGAVVKDWSDPRAVHLGANRKPAGAGNPPAIERNPAADPAWLHDDDNPAPGAAPQAPGGAST